MKVCLLQLNNFKLTRGWIFQQERAAKYTLYSIQPNCDSRTSQEYDHTAVELIGQYLLLLKQKQHEAIHSPHYGRYSSSLIPFGSVYTHVWLSKGVFYLPVVVRALPTTIGRNPKMSKSFVKVNFHKILLWYIDLSLIIDLNFIHIQNMC